MSIILLDKRGFVDYSKRKNAMSFTAVYQKQGKWYLGWVEEVPGVNTQGATLAEAKENLKEALAMVLDANRSMVEQERPRGKIIREKIRL